MQADAGEARKRRGVSGVTLCAIMKNECRYILEWVAYHRLVGFKRLVVYSNDSTDGSVELLDALAQAGVLAHRIQPTLSQISPQHAAYNDAVAKAETQWICFLDADEFLLLKRDPDIDGFVARFDETVSAIGINWRFFGSAGRERYEPEPVIARFTRAAEPDNPLNLAFKSIVRPERVSRAAVHWSRLHSGDYVNGRGEIIERENFGFTPSVATELAQVNHYCSKSKEEFEAKRRRGVADRPLGDPQKFTLRDNPGAFPLIDRNECDDLALVAMLGRVEAEMESLRELVKRSGFLLFR